MKKRCLLALIFGLVRLAQLAPTLAADASASPHKTPYVWKNVQIIGGGFVDGIVFNPSAKNVLYARTDIGGAYRWSHRSLRWIALMDWIPAKDWNLMGVESIGVDPANAQRVYLAVGTYTNQWAGNGAILRSSDGGRSWIKTDLPFQVGGNMDGRFAGERLAVDPNDDSILYFGSRNNGLWKSSDFGAQWSQATGFPVSGYTNGTGVVFTLFQKSSGRKGQPTPVIYAGVQQNGPSLYRSADGGTTWAVVAAQPAGLLPNHGVFGSRGRLYLTYANAPGPNGVSRGAVWKYNTRSSVWTDITPIKTGLPGASGYGGLAVDAQRPDTIMTSTIDRWNPGDTLFRSVNAGQTWIDIGPETVRSASLSPWVTFGAKKAPLGWWLGALAIDPFRPGHVLYGTGATIWSSRDVTNADQGLPTHWSVGAQGIEETAVLHLLSPTGGAHLFSSLGDIGSFRHRNLHLSPSRGMPLPVMYNVTLASAEHFSQMVVRTGSGSNGTFGVISLNYGRTWTPFPTYPSGAKGGGPVAISEDGKTILWAAQGAVPCVTDDLGNTWTPCQGLPTPIHVVADSVNPDLFYALNAQTGALYTSSDGGKSFSETRTLAGGGSQLYNAPDAVGDLWIVSKGALFHCRGEARSFIPVTTVQNVSAFGMGKAAPAASYSALYVIGTVDGVAGIFRSDNVGRSWTQINDSQHQYAARNVITGDPRVYGRVYIGTNGRGIIYGDPASTPSLVP